MCRPAIVPVALALFLVSLPVTFKSAGVPQTTHFEGYVIDADTDAPLPDVRVIVRQNLLVPPISETVTDAAGFFSVDDVPPGRWSVELLKDGYVRRGHWFPNQTPAANVELAPGGEVRLQSTMVRSGSVSGRVYNNERQPVVGAQVKLLTVDYDRRSGRRIPAELSGLDSVQTDELGEYRFEGVQPREYYVQVLSHTEPQAESDGQILRSETPATGITYYPGFRDTRLAATVAVLPGTVRSAVDIPLPLPSSFTVSGAIVNAFHSGAELPDYRFFLVPETGDSDIAVLDYDDDPHQFELRDVTPGNYFLYVLYQPAITSSREIRWPHFGEAVISVADDESTDLVVQILPNVDVTGRIEFDGLESAEQRATFSPLLELADSKPVALSPNPKLQRLRIVQPDGTFVMPDMMPGNYTLDVIPYANRPGGSYIGAARFGGQDVDGYSFKIGPERDGPLVLTIRSDGGQVTGRLVSRNGDPIPFGSVVLVPPAQLRQHLASYRMNFVDDFGRFSIEWIRPGTYTVFGFRDIVPAAAFLNPEFRAEHRNRGVEIEVGPLMVTDIDLEIE